MVRPASFDRTGIKRGVWSEEEDNKLRACIDRFGHSNWRLLPLVAGLKRCGKSCRLRWVNYLKPGLRRGKFTKDEENRIIELHNQLGNKWSAIAAYFPRRTDNDIKNYWHAHVKKRSKRGHNSESRAGRAITNNDSSVEADTVEAFNQAAENMGVFESNIVDSDYNTAALYQRCFSNLGIDDRNFVQEEFDYSEWGINGHWNLSAAAKSQQDFWAESVEEDVFNIKFW